jgi:hypothetical protein
VDLYCWAELGVGGGFGRRSARRTEMVGGEWEKEEEENEGEEEEEWASSDN